MPVQLHCYRPPVRHPCNSERVASIVPLHNGSPRRRPTFWRVLTTILRTKHAWNPAAAELALAESATADRVVGRESLFRFHTRQRFVPTLPSQSARHALHRGHETCD